MRKITDESTTNGANDSPANEEDFSEDADDAVKYATNTRNICEIYVESMFAIKQLLHKGLPDLFVCVGFVTATRFQTHYKVCDCFF